ncbi:MAG: inositol oxygenase family protein [Verrucomicrobiales bacterium]
MPKLGRGEQDRRAGICFWARALGAGRGKGSGQALNPYDLYTQSHAKPDAQALRPLQVDLIAEYFPAKIDW